MSQSPAQDSPPSLALDDHLSAIAIKAVQKAFSTLFSVDPKSGTVSIEKDFVSKGDVSGLLGMVQDRIEATLVLSFPRETICALLGKMYGHNFDQIDSSIKQGVGELTNIIYALTKKGLNDRGHAFKMSIPSVIIGSNHSIINIHEGMNMVIPFVVEISGQKNDFCLQIARQESPY